MSDQTSNNQEENSVEQVESAYPLSNCWSLWHYDNSRSRDWKENLKEVYTFFTVEGFWRMYNHIQPPSDLKQGCDYSLFKQGIKPMWEDEANVRGGRWLINLDRKQRGNDLDNYWLEILLLLIGATLIHDDEVCGVTVNIRARGDKIGLWTSNANNKDAVLEIGKKLKDVLHFSPNAKISYQLHSDTSEKTGSNTKSTYTV